MTSWANFSRNYRLLPNGLSITRGFLGLSLPYFITRSEPVYHVTGLFIFMLGVLTDYLDGYLARRWSQETSLGKLIDPITDKILILAPLITFGTQGLYSLWWVVPIVIREIVVTFCRLGWLLEGKVLGAEKFGKYKLGFQVAAVSAAFLYFLANDWNAMAKLSFLLGPFMIFCLALAVILTLQSGFSFLAHHRENFQSSEFSRFVSAVYVGYMPIAPGTWGSLVGLVIYALVSWNLWLYVVIYLSLAAVGYWAVSKIDLRTRKDPSYVVMDEVLGMMLVWMGVPFTPVSALAGFVLFRLFDIVKPFPLRRLERLPGYWGILCDDLGAGLYAWAVMFFLLSRWLELF